MVQAGRVMDAYVHPAFPQPENQDCILWRYIDLWKFEWLASWCRLLMPAARCLGDPLEGTRPGGDIRWWDRQVASTCSPERRRVAVHNHRFISAAAAMVRESAFVSCWSMNARESLQMWSCYTTGPDSVAVCTTYGTLRRLLPKYVECGVVRYVEHPSARFPTFNIFEYVMHKDSQYRFENEARAVAFQPATGPQGLSEFRQHLFESETKPDFHVFAPPVDLGTLVTRVVLHPGATGDVADVVRQWCSERAIPAPVQSELR